MESQHRKSIAFRLKKAPTPAGEGTGGGESLGLCSGRDGKLRAVVFLHQLVGLLRHSAGELLCLSIEREQWSADGLEPFGVDLVLLEQELDAARAKIRKLEAALSAAPKPETIAKPLIPTLPAMETLRIEALEAELTAARSALTTARQQNAALRLSSLMARRRQSAPRRSSIASTLDESTSRISCTDGKYS